MIRDSTGVVWGPEHLVAQGALAAIPRDARVEVRTFTAAADWMRAEVARALETQRWLAHEVSAARAAGELPIVFAGNCMTSVGTVSGMRARDGRSPAVCWFDAHADMHTPETTHSAFVDGMALAALTGRCWKNVVTQVP